jgi:cellulose synthase/poly-beta-1,6-N-acetylglucosamine synthase-like glycosyltransferase/GGDEF domain-containing protein
VSQVQVFADVQIEEWRTEDGRRLVTPRHPDALLADLDAVLDDDSRTAQPALAVIDIAEAYDLTVLHGQAAADAIGGAVAKALAALIGPKDLVERDERGRFLVLFQTADQAHVNTLLEEVGRRVASVPVEIAEERRALTPVMGWVALDPADHTHAHQARERAFAAMDAALGHLDLQPVRWVDSLEASTDSPDPVRHPRLAPAREVLRLPAQIAATLVVGLVLPLLAYLALGALGVNITGIAYIVVVLSLLGTTFVIWTEGLLATEPLRPPPAAAPAPPAAAIIAAYLPNEADVIVHTVESFLRADYPDLQVILAYNTPTPLPVEAQLQQLAQSDPRFVPFRVEGSTSKAQNVNAALSLVNGEFVGVFDADHNPDPDSFHRAWRWLSNGYDVVQGHCVVRNGNDSLVARTIAVEFESIYAVSHPGRARLHGFGIFGGSNGYWRTDTLRATRMRGSMLTEDIDSSVRVVHAGGRIANDPGLVSRELGPTTVKALWNQRLRWAQGWFQVSKKHLRDAWTNPNLNLRQRLGMTLLLGWREVYPWISIQALPILAYALLTDGPDGLNWLIPLFVLTTVLTSMAGPIQTLLAYRLAEPSIRRNPSWFVAYLITGAVYTEFKNTIARVAQIKELVGERAWKVTPRDPGSIVKPSSAEAANA